MRRVAVIIPYFQRDPGILSRALTSVAAQDLPPDVSVRVIIVDDASPAPVAPELNSATDLQLEVLSQENGGPGAARNSALDHVLGDTDFVAFLDSDDIWLPDHVSHALACLGQDFDFYCCDNARPGSFASMAEEAPALKDKGAGLAQKSTLLDADIPVRGFAPHALDDEIVTGYLSHTSTVVLRADIIGETRFDPELRGASEDRMFWISLALKGARVVVSWATHVQCGQGVNVFFSAYDWNAPATLERLGSQLLFALKLKRQHALSPLRQAFATDRARTRRRAYSFLFIRTLLRFRAPPLRTFRRLLRVDPLLPLRMPGLFLSVMLDQDRRNLEL